MITFLKNLIKDVIENVGVWISASKRGEKSTTKYLSAYPIFFF